MTEERVRWRIAPEVFEVVIEWPQLSEIKDELTCPKFANHLHGSPGTYNKGCRGPVCKLANREVRRIKYAQKMHRQGREVEGYAPREHKYEDLLIAVAILCRRQYEERNASRIWAGLNLAV